MKKIFYLFFIVFFSQCSPKVNFHHLEGKNLYGLQGKLTAKEGQGQELAKVLMQAAELMKKAKGCRLYSVGIDINNPEDIWISEIWDSKNDHDASLKSPEVRALIGMAIPMLAENPQQGKELKILGGLGIK